MGSAAQFIAVVPARFGSSRLPGKPLLDIAGEPMVAHVWRRACESQAQRVIVATDDERIRDAMQAYGAEVVMTRADHPSGTDRLAEVAEQLSLAGDTLVVNVQGDEPLIPPVLIDQVAQRLADDPEHATRCGQRRRISRVRSPPGHSARKWGRVSVAADRMDFERRSFLAKLASSRCPR